MPARKKNESEKEYKVRLKEYSQRPEVKERNRQKARRYRNSPKGKIKRKEYEQRSEVQVRRKELAIRPENIEKRKFAKRKYKKSPKGIAKKLEYEAKPENQEKHRVRERRYRNSPKGKIKRKEYFESPEGKAKRKEYFERPEVKKRIRELSQTPEYKARVKRYTESLRGKEKRYVSSLKYRDAPKDKERIRKSNQSPKGKAYKKKWYEEHKHLPEFKEKRRIISQRWAAKPEHKTKKRDYQRKKRLKNPNLTKEKNLKLKIEVFNHYCGGKIACASCGEDCLEFLETNHVKSRKEMGHANDLTGSALHGRLRKDDLPEGINILCSNCNWLDNIEKKRMKTPVSKYREHALRKKIETFTHYSNGKPKCSCCNIDNIDVLSIDHINPKSISKVRKNLIGLQLYIHLIKNNFPSGFQVFCRNCNQSKSDKSMCYHQLKKYV